MMLHDTPMFLSPHEGAIKGVLIVLISTDIDVPIYIKRVSAVYPIFVVEMSNQVPRKSSLISKLPENMILSPDILQVSTIIGQGSKLVP